MIQILNKLVYLNEPSEDTYFGKLLIEMDDKTFLGDLNREDDTQNIPDEIIEYEVLPKTVFDSQGPEVEIIAEQINIVESSETEDNTASRTIKEISDNDDKSLVKKKSDSWQKKMWFAMKSKLPEKKRLPSPYQK